MLVAPEAGPIAAIRNQVTVALAINRKGHLEMIARIDAIQRVVLRCGRRAAGRQRHIASRGPSLSRDQQLVLRIMERE